MMFLNFTQNKSILSDYLPKFGKKCNAIVINYAENKNIGCRL